MDEELYNFEIRIIDNTCYELIIIIYRVLHQLKEKYLNTRDHLVMTVWNGYPMQELCILHIIYCGR